MPNGDPVQTASFLGVAGMVAIGMYGVMSAEKTHTSYKGSPKDSKEKRKRDGRGNGHWYNLLGFELNRNFQYGLAILAGVLAWIIGYSAIFPALSYEMQMKMSLGYETMETGAYILGIFMAVFVGLLVLSIDAFPLVVIALAIPITIFVIIEQWLFFWLMLFLFTVGILITIYLWQERS